MNRARRGVFLALALASSAYAITIAGTVVDDQGKSISGVEVMMAPRAVGAYDPAAPPPRTSVLTGEDGGFRFEVQDRVLYALATNYKGMQEDLLRRTEADARSGKDMLGIRIVLYKPGVITGTVRDSDGDPVAGAGVEAIQYVTIRHRRQLISRGGGTTDDRGGYRLNVLVPGRMYVRAVNRALRSALGFRTRYYPNADDLSHARAVDIKGGSESRGIDIGVTLTKTYAVRGKLVGRAAGETNVGVDVELIGGDVGFPERGPNRYSYGNTFEVPGVVPGDYLVLLGGGPTVSLAGAAPPPPRFGRVPVRVVNSDVNDVVLQIAGYAVRDGTVTLEDGTPVRAEVTMDYQEPFVSVLGVPARSRETDESGRFHLESLIPGKQLVTVMASDHPLFVKSINETKVDLKNPFQFNADGGSTGELRIVVSRQTASLKGAATADAFAAIWPMDVASWNPHAVNAIRVSADGKYSFQGLAPGKYFVDAWTSDRRDFEDVVYDPEFLKQFENRAKVVELSEGNAVSIDLPLTPADSTQAALDKIP